MAGAWRKAAVYLGLVEDDGIYDQDGYADAEDERPARRRASTAVAAEPEDYRPTEVVPVPVRPLAAVPTDEVPWRRPAVSSAQAAAKISMIQPRSYNQAREIGEHFREGGPVILNVTEMPEGEAKRIVDFAAGLVFGLHGSLERVTRGVFLLSPANVDVKAEAQARLEATGLIHHRS